MKNRSAFLVIAMFMVTSTIVAQNSGTITVGGDFNQFYPVTWYDGNWSTGPSEVYITRPDVHENSTWRGSLSSKFVYHLTNWGHGASFVQPFITSNVVNFIAGYRDATPANSTLRLIIWLRGGGTTYHYSSSTNVAPVVYDGVQNALPFVEINGPSHNAKTSVDNYINTNGTTSDRDNFNTGVSYLMGNVGIGTRNLEYALNVNGIIKTEEVKVVVDVPADYVFAPEYKLTTIEELKNFVSENHHLPGVPSASELSKEGWEVGAMSNKMLEKIEELTLYIISLKEENDLIRKELTELKKKN